MRVPTDLFALVLFGLAYGTIFVVVRVGAHFEQDGWVGKTCGVESTPIKGAPSVSILLFIVAACTFMLTRRMLHNKPRAFVVLVVWVGYCWAWSTRWRYVSEFTGDACTVYLHAKAMREKRPVDSYTRPVECLDFHTVAGLALFGRAGCLAEMLDVLGQLHTHFLASTIVAVLVALVVAPCFGPRATPPPAAAAAVTGNDVGVPSQLLVMLALDVSSPANQEALRRRELNKGIVEEANRGAGADSWLRLAVETAGRIMAAPTDDPRDGDAAWRTSVHKQLIACLAIDFAPGAGRAEQRDKAVCRALLDLHKQAGLALIEQSRALLTTAGAIPRAGAAAAQ